MNTISIHEVNPNDVTSIGDTAIYLRLFYPELVEEILESYNECSDVEIIQEIIDTEGLPIACVIEHSHLDLIIHGYIRHRGVAS